MSKDLFDVACKIVLRSVFNLNAIDVDGPHDGGTDVISVKKDGERTSTAYQITTQKKNIKKKAIADAKKSITKLGVGRFYFITSFPLSETEARKLENEITEEADINATCFGANNISGFLIKEGLLGEFLDEANYPLPKGVPKRPDYREMAFHGYTLMSDDARSMRDSIYDDTILLIASEESGMVEDELIEKVVAFLGLDPGRAEAVKRRVGALFGREALVRNESTGVKLSDKLSEQMRARKCVYEKELEDISGAQVDLMRTDFGVDWTLENSKAISVFIADAYVAEQLKALKEVKIGNTTNPLFGAKDRGVASLKKHLLKEGEVKRSNVEEATTKLIQLASGHPLITKLARASVFIALEGSDPIASAKALGAGRWSDFKMLVEPSVAIPWICFQLYGDRINRLFDNCINAVERAKSLDISLQITYFYINECAGHLLRARNYVGLDLDPKELEYSPNAFISNYYALKNSGGKVPDDVMAYLKTFSPAIMVERSSIKEWVRSIMTDIQSILNRSGVEFIDVKKYSHEDCQEFEKAYSHILDEFSKNKPKHLIDHDVWALQMTRDAMVNKGDHYLILTCDKTMISIGRSERYPGWIITPHRFLDLVSIHGPLADSKYISLLHSLASFSEKSLSAGARIIDRAVQLASPEMQNWEFLEKIQAFKKDLLAEADLDAFDVDARLDRETLNFLRKLGVEKLPEEEVVADG